jgi:hypothetical protein
MQDQQQLQEKPALQPKPQIRKQGADGRTWKRPEPAAILEKIPLSLIIYYPDEPPPQATVKGVAFEDKNDGLEYSVVEFEGVNALTTVEPNFKGPDWEAALPGSFNLGTGPFTLETSLRTGVDIDTFAELRMYDGEFGDNFFFIVFVSIEVLNSGNYLVRIQADLQDERFRLDRVVPALSGEAVDDVKDFAHVSFQRINSRTYVLHRKGVVIKTWELPEESPPIDFGSIDTTKIRFSAISDAGLPMPAVTQIRLTNTALYGTRNFKPPTRPFFVPPQP